MSGDHCAEFSKVPCEICGSKLAGARYEVSYLG
jgi:ribosome-binding protein aMBF1 (putative translation factor)